MRIFQVLSAQATGGVGLSQIWLRNLYEPLVDMGYDVLLFRAEEGAQAKARRAATIRAAFSHKLLDAFRREHARKSFDLFFAYLMDGMIEPGAIDEIRKLGVPTCNFSCNNTHQFDLVDELSPHFDYSLHSEKDSTAKFRAIGANPIWFPMAANPQYYHPYDVPRALDVTFVGQKYARRPYYIWHLLENGIDVQVYGPGWRLSGDGGHHRGLLRQGRRLQMALRALVASSLDTKAKWSARLAWLDFGERLRVRYDANMHPPLSDEEMIRKYSESKISLGFLEVYDEHNPAATVKQHLHLRDFEGPMCGALYLTGYCEELAEFYEPDAEVLVYMNEHEMLDKVRYYLSHLQDAERVRRAGQKRALSCHTYQRRFQDLFSHIGLQG
jgi:spore maturation protein CgeB